MKDKIVVNYIENSKYNKNFKKFKNDTIDTVILKETSYYGRYENINNITINNLVIDYKPPIFYKYNAHIILNDIRSKNVFFNNENNLGNITIPVEYLKKNNIGSIQFNWDYEKNIFANLDEINIITENVVHKINLMKEELQKIDIYMYDSGIINIKIKNIYSEVSYEIRNDKLYKTILSYHVREKHLNNGELDLSNFKEFGSLKLNDINIDTLVINKKDISRLKSIENQGNVFIKNIKVIDNNEMKLNPVKIIPFNDKFNMYKEYILGNERNILIFQDNKYKLRVYDKNEILKDEKIEDVRYIFGKNAPIIIYKYKKQDKYKVIIDGEEYNINKLFMLYFKEEYYKYIYFTKETKEEMENNDLVYIMKKLGVKIFYKVYNDYKIFLENLNKRIKSGFSYKYFMYLHERGLDSVIIQICKEDSFYDYISKEEVEDLNKLSKKYIKTLKK